MSPKIYFRLHSTIVEIDVESYDIERCYNPHSGSWNRISTCTGTILRIHDFANNIECNDIVYKEEFYLTQDITRHINMKLIKGEYVTIHRSHKKELFSTYDKAFYHNFLEEKIWKLFPDGNYYGIIKSYYSNSYNVCFESYYIDGISNGPFKSYNYEGNLMEEGMYVDGKKNGVCTQYTLSGTIYSTCEYLNGKLNGCCREYSDVSMTIKSETMYVDGKKKGKCLEYCDVTGIIKCETMYIDDKKMENAYAMMKMERNWRH